ncbi:hypothetical protein SAMN05216178_2031 [Pseudomonas saponiphila]|uniref:Uncharacterized protein n=1 Tax=Pseudomonas saponiphila TaxID=556534 RepID=A0A1H4LQJ5_9PSED|nr:hypothetical protein [Pseudomonas saponiphila]SEB72908.1 hypothetical protein SAMN05216178_2031 [Pseudomonas saponiphila]
MSKIQWHCTQIGVDGWLLIAADQDLTGPNDPESMLGHRRAFHPFQLDEDPQALARAIGEMSEVMARVQLPLMQFDPETGEISIVQALPASRAHAFGG